MIYERKANQTVCIMKEATGRSCHGSLKKYMPFASDYGELVPAVRQEIAAKFGSSPQLTLYKCNFCRMVYADPLPAKR
jgi:hypothetical protein